MNKILFRFLRVCAQLRGSLFIFALSLSLVAPGCSFKAHVKTSASTSGKSASAKSKSTSKSKKKATASSSSRGSRASIKVSGQKKFKASFKSGSKKVFTSKKRVVGLGSSGKKKDSFRASFKLRKKASAQAKLRLKMKKSANTRSTTSKKKTVKFTRKTPKSVKKKKSSTGIKPKKASPKAPVVKKTTPKNPPSKETPVTKAPVVAPPVQEPPVEEPPVQEPPVQETPVEEPPVQEPPVEEAPVEEPPAPIEPPEAPPENVFGYDTPVHGCFEGIVYPIDPKSKRLPTDYESLDAVSALYACEWDIPVRDWAQGFPELEDYFEWFAIRYSGSFNLEVGGEWSFRLASDDGSKLLIDGEVVLDNDGVHAPRQKTATVQLEAGDHELVLEYFQGPRFHINLQLYATPPGGEEGVFSVR